MHPDQITLNELYNDGQTIHLYYLKMDGVYAAFGLSAYLLTNLPIQQFSQPVQQLTQSVQPLVSYSDEMQMPVALLLPAQLEELRRRHTIGRWEPQNYCRLDLPQRIDDAGYAAWATPLRAEHLISVR